MATPSPTTPPQRLALPDAAPDPAAMTAAVTAWERGELVLAPMETVYGLSARADDPAALARLVAAKEQPESRAFTWHAADSTALDHFGALRPLARRLAERFWPGPLTLILGEPSPALGAMARNGAVGVRVPAHAGLRGLLAAAPFPVVATSANRHGNAPGVECDTAAAHFGDQLGLVLDGGTSRLGEPSAVLRLTPGHFELERAGLHDIESLRRAAGLRIAFVCTGNTCRSPMAERLAHAALAKRLGTPEIGQFGFNVQSMGVFASAGGGPSRGSVEALARRNLDLTDHRSQPAVPDALMGLDRVYCLTSAHREALRSILPPERGPELELLDPQGRDVPDPVGGDLPIYLACADAIEAMVEARLDEWA